MPQSAIRKPQPAMARRAFTLVELMVVITIIATLASIVLVAMFSAQEAARASKTRLTVAKLNDIILPLYNSYQTRRVNVDIQAEATSRGWVGAGRPTSREAARIRLDALRELMKMEMPDRWSDVTDTINTSGLARPRVSVSYQNFYSAATRSGLYDDAECLFLIVTRLGDDGLEHFTPSEMGDIDGDGAREFVDGWNRPIRFLRWAPGYQSQLQTAVASSIDGHQPDPFDPLKIYPNSAQPQATFKLVPLIYSAGPDGIYDIRGSFTGFTYGANSNNPFYVSGTELIGQPAPNVDAGGDDAELEHYDNITNHDIARR